MTQARVTVKVWDLPVRLFHWSVVALLVVSWRSYEAGAMEVHRWSGYAILTLVLFRVLWGLFGSESARFSRFLGSPAAALAHLRQFARREPDTDVTHNAAGGWMVLVLLALLAFQAATGLMANDDIMFEGPLAAFVGKEASDSATRLHHLNWTLILCAVGLHVLAVLAYALLRRVDLVRPMVTGRKHIPAEAGVAAPRLASPLRAAGLLAVACAVVAAVVRL